VMVSDKMFDGVRNEWKCGTVRRRRGCRDFVEVRLACDERDAFIYNVIKDWVGFSFLRQQDLDITC
jgi:hypothetical protein